MVCVPCLPRVWTKDKRICVFFFSLVQTLTAAGAGELTESPLSTPIVQIGDVGEHVIDPVIAESSLAYDTRRATDQ